MPTISGQRITHCPVCNYDLTGLPKNHHCPECGFEYDESTAFWDWRVPRWRLWAFGVLVVVMWTSKTWRSLVGLSNGSVTPDWILLGFDTMWAVGVAVVLYGACGGAMVVVGKQGFYIRRPFSRGRSFGWNEVTFASPGAPPEWRSPRKFLPRKVCARMPSKLDSEVLFLSMYVRWMHFQESQCSPLWGDVPLPLGL